MKYIYSLLLGALFSIIIVKGEVISWFRIQEMFRFESFHMFGVIGSAVAVGAISILLIKKFKIKSIKGDEIVIPEKPKKYKGNYFGGVLFGLGWAMTGACPGPLYAHIGYGHTIIIIAIVWAVLGVFVYGLIKNKLPH
jgi:uncharacterized membrane protein YedE/YeeE